MIRSPFVRGAALALALALPPLAARAATPAPHSPVIAAGTYLQIDTVTGKPLVPASELVVLAGKNGRLGFSLNAVRPLNTNQGFVAGVLGGRTLPLVWTQSAASGNCRLRFEAAGRDVRVIQDTGFGDCGFDAGVTANGTYGRVAEKP